MRWSNFLLKMIFVLFVGSIAFICYGLAENTSFCIYGVMGIAISIDLIFVWTSHNYVWICKECYLRFEIPAKKLLVSFSVHRGCRKLFCPKCRKKTMCKGKKVVIRAHVY